MRISRTLATAVVAATALTTVALGASACNKSPQPKSNTTQTPGAPASSAPPAAGPPPQSAPPAAPGEYTGLLIGAADIKAPEPFTAGAPTQNPDGQPGAAVTFSDADGSYVIDDMVQVFADPAAASAALDAAKAAFGNALKNPKVAPINIGTGGTTAFGNKLDGSKGQLILVFTEGRALITLKFSGPLSLAPPPDFVSDVGQKQDAAVKKGLGG